MPDEPNNISRGRLARWIVLAVLIAGGVVLYFRDGVRLRPFGAAAPVVATDSLP